MMLLLVFCGRFLVRYVIPIALGLTMAFNLVTT